MAAREGECEKIDHGEQFRAIQILVSYGYGMPVRRLTEETLLQPSR
jgi:hypothetical protein